MWEKAFEVFLKRLVSEGTLHVTLPSGRVVRAGEGAPEIAVRMSDPALPRQFCLTPEMAFGDLLGKCGKDAIARMVAHGGIHAICRGKVDVGADQVDQRQRAEPIAGGLHRGVNITGRAAF